MKVKNITLSPNFGNVYGVYGTGSQIESLYNRIVREKSGNKNLMIIPATDEFMIRKNKGVLEHAAKVGKKQIALLITGQKDYDRVNFQEYGWATIDGISKHIKEIFNLNKINENQIQEIITSTSKDKRKPSPSKF